MDIKHEGEFLPDPQAEPPVKEMTPIRRLANQVWAFIMRTLGEGAELGSTNADMWKFIAAYLALFNVQLTIKYKLETTKSGEKRYVFFVSNGKPREMSSLRLNVEAAAGFLKLPGAFRLLLTRSFPENAQVLETREPFAIDKFPDLETQIVARELAGALVAKIK